MPAFDVSAGGNRQVDGRPLVADGGTETIIPTGSGTTTSPWIYDWDNIDGGGNDASDHLILGNSRLWTTNHSAAGLGSFALKLRNANGKGNILGNSGVIALATTNATALGANPATVGSITLSNVNHIAIGGIDTSRRSTSTSTPGGNSGHITIGHPLDRAGDVRIDFIRTGAHLRTYSRGNAGNVTIYGNSYVKIMNSSGVLGDIIAWTIGYDGGRITINHDGDFMVRHINAESGGGWSGGARGRWVRLSGDALKNGANGMCYIAGSITNAQTRAVYGANNENVDIEGYTNVFIAGGIYSYNATPSAYTAGNIYITNITGDITIGGPIHANAANGDTRDGDLKLWCTGTIRLDSLDLSIVKTAQLYGNNHSWIKRDLTFFPVATPANGELDAKAGQRIYYGKWSPYNAYLGLSLIHI
ncbi:MAG: hypothetical protein N3G20_06500, partial [Verrucomicrobiae bacterium]|nr:hypothetical protein [Verrucomicrobiae bacterium]